MTAIENTRVIDTDESSIWKCQCICSNIVNLSACKIQYRINHGSLSSCGCKNNEVFKTIKNITGKTYGLITAIEPLNKTCSYSKSRLWLCECKCGKRIETSVKRLRKMKSCGCDKSTTINYWKKWRELRGYSEYDKFRENYEYKQIRINIYKRDNYKCIICNNNKKLNMHHINSWNIFKNERCDMNNLCLLCKNCHSSFHSTYGYGNNTKEQLVQYCWLKSVDIESLLEERRGLYV